MDINPNTSSIEEMRQYVRDELGHNLEDSVAEAEVRRVVSEATGIALETAKPKPRKRLKRAIDPNGRVRIVLHKTGDVLGDEDVKVGVNGKIYLIQRGVEVDVPASVVDVLTNAVEDRYEWKVNPHTKEREMVGRKAQSYPFAVLGPA